MVFIREKRNNKWQKTKKTKPRTQRGQVTLFVILCFQILFVFFSMVINVGLVVHHKINLQNSVDMAAYYGAAKMAENMNMIAHINYQIRQAWKLLTWRYRVIGTSGSQGSPGEGNSVNRTYLPRVSGWDALDDVATSQGPAMSTQNGAPFCILYPPWRPNGNTQGLVIPPGQNVCKNASTNIPLFSVPQVNGALGSFSGIFQQVANATQVLLNQAQNACEFQGSLNYFMLANFIVAYKVDVRDRMSLLTHIARSLSISDSQFTDLDGGNAVDGAKKTLIKNLTLPNAEGLSEVRFYNSLGSANCGVGSGNTNELPKWLSRLNIYPVFTYVDSIQCIGSVATGPRALTENTKPTYYNSVGAFKSVIDGLAPLVGDSANPQDNYNFNLGVEKNPWCMAYFGVYAKAKPKIPFMPAGALTIEARGFAKPFGGRIGPWYTSTWSPSSLTSDPGRPKLDPLLPKRIITPQDRPAQSSTIDLNQPNEYVPNYSRFVGDLFGIRTFKSMFQWGRALFMLNMDYNASLNPAPSNNPRDGEPNLASYSELPVNFSDRNQSQPTGDPLAWSDRAPDPPGRLRFLEMAAILPDNFDQAYYSIEPDYYNVYLKRFETALKAGKFGQMDVLLRGDLGSRLNDPKLKSFSVKNQILQVWDKLGRQYLTLDAMNSGTGLTYLNDNNWAHLLTGWIESDVSDHQIDQSRFGECQIAPEGGNLQMNEQGGTDPRVPTSGYCARGGTTGYAVKLVSGDYLNYQRHKVGGETAGEGSLRNPPPDPSGWRLAN